MATDYYLRGGTGMDKAGGKFSQNGNVITLTTTLDYTGWWKIADASWSSGTIFGKDNSAGNPSLDGTAYTCKQPGDDNFSNTFSGTYTFTLNTSTKVLTITSGAPGPTPGECDNCQKVTR